MALSELSTLPAVRISGWDNPLGPSTAGQLATLLPDFIKSRRWFRSKARTIAAVSVQDIVALPAVDSCLLIARIDYTDGAGDEYQIPLSIRRGDPASLLLDVEEVVAIVQGPEGTEGLLFGALSNDAFRNALIDAIACDRTFEGEKGELRASHTKAFTQPCGLPTVDLQSFVSRAEQSNTSVIYRDRFILKIFRKLEAGINPDVEIGRFLTEHEFKHTPAVLGTLEYRSHASQLVYAAAILQDFVPNLGDAWKHTLESLEGYFSRALSTANTASPDLPTYHPMLLMDQTLPEAVHKLIGPYVGSAELLGKRTAEMHAVLAQPDKAGPDTLPHFEPEKFGPSDGQKLYDEMVAQALITFGLLLSQGGALPDAAGESGRQLLQKESDVIARFSALQMSNFDAVRIRYHGDYHLGQVLYTGDDFKIIDFEGEPARPLSERRGKTLAMRDVAGMVRSFEYAAYAALFGQVPGVPTDLESRPKVVAWAAFWSAWVSAIYLKAYFDTAAGKPFVPRSRQDQHTLLDAFLLQKALYEVAYEFNNRPDWVRIPLSGILKLIT